MGSPEEVSGMMSYFQREIDNVITGVINLVYFMRGAIGYEEMLRRTVGERQRVSEFLERRLKEEGKKDFPNY